MWRPSGLGAKRDEQRARIQAGNDLARKPPKKALVEWEQIEALHELRPISGADAPPESASSAGL